MQADYDPGAVDATAPEGQEGSMPPADLTTTPSIGPVAALRAGWGLVGRDPVGVLVPAGGILLLQAAVWLDLRAGVGVRTVTEASLRFTLGLLLVAVLSAPLRVAVLQAGARCLPRRGLGLRRSAAMAGAQLVVATIQGLWISASLVVLALVGGGALAYGWWSVASLGGALVLLGSACGYVLLQTAVAWVPVAVVVGGHSGLGAVVASLRHGDWGTALASVVGGGLATGLGGLLCGAGALPGYPLRDLALLVAYQGDP